MNRQIMSKQEAIAAGWKPITHYQPKSFLGGSFIMWESPDRSYKLFCLPYRGINPTDEAISNG